LLRQVVPHTSQSAQSAVL